MRSILAVDDDMHDHAPPVPLIAISGYAFSALETNDPACFRMALSLGATRCLRKPFRPATLLAVIDKCLSEAEQRRKHAAALAAIAGAPLKIFRESANTG
jgi:CheY-like chemotaxis protein